MQLIICLPHILISAVYLSFICHFVIVSVTVARNQMGAAARTGTGASIKSEHLGVPTGGQIHRGLFNSPLVVRGNEMMATI
jgi:hypothetical protein